MALYSASSFSSHSHFYLSRSFSKPFFMPIFSCLPHASRAPYNNALISEAVRILGPPARFEASKLTVDFMGQEVEKCSRVLPRIYILSHCDFTADLTLTISNIINVDQLQGWYSKDDVVAEWKEMNGRMCLVVHCFVSGPNNFFRDLVAELRYHIFTKELPLVLQAVLYGDSALFREYPELMDSVVWVYFHSSSTKYNGVEQWGPLKDAAQRGIEIQNSLTSKNQGTPQQQKLQNPKSFFQALFTFLL
ncbi:hypothetical protein vseg_017530 [Gypsophila vaccaria]